MMGVMSDFYRKKAKEDQLNKQVDEIYDIVFTGPKWLHLKFAEKYEKKLIMNEIKNSSYEEVKASKIKLAQINKKKIAKWNSPFFLILRIIGVVIFIAGIVGLVWLLNIDYAEVCIKNGLDCAK